MALSCYWWMRMKSANSITSPTKSFLGKTSKFPFSKLMNGLPFPPAQWLSWL